MKSLNIKWSTLLWMVIGLGWNLNLSGQSITGISASGAVVVQTGTNYAISWTATSGTNASYKSIDVSFTGVTGNTEVWFRDTSSQTSWELQYGSVSSNAWKDFCPSARAQAWKPNSQLGQGSGTATVYIRNSNTKSGTYSNLITFGFGTDCNSITTAITIQATVTIVDSNANIYTWSEPPTGATNPTDSSYKIAANWTPTRTTPSPNDVLVVDLAQGSTRNTTIYMDGVNDQIDQFVIYPYNNVTFRCSTSTNSGDWSIGKSTSTSGDDFRLDTLAGMRFNGGTLDLNLASGNTAMFKSNVNVVSGTLNLNGPGTFTHRKDINIAGGSLNYKSSALTTLNLAGTNTKLSGTGGTLYIDSTVNVIIGNGSTSNYTLERVLPIISNLSLKANTTLISNAPTSYTSVSDINSWTPYLQLKATPKPNSTAHGQLLELPSGASVTNGAQFEIYNNKQRAYRAFGIPLSGGTMIPQFTDDIDVTGNVSGSNANEFTTTCSWCTHSIFQWNETSSSWSPYSSGNTVTTIPVGTGILTFFRGARGNGLGDTTVVANEEVLDFKGELTEGSLNVTLNNGGTGTLKGYNLVGNPYPCAIDLRMVYETNKSKLLPRFYLYDAIARRYNEYDSVSSNANSVTPTKNGTSKFQNPGNGSKRLSQVLDAGGAAFFVLNSNNSSESITFNESHKINNFRSATKHFSSGVQEENTVPCDQLKGQLSYQDKANTENDGFTIEFDREGINADADLYDMSKLYAGYIGCGTLTANNSWLSIDRRDKIANIGETKSIPLKVAYPKEGPTAMEFSFNFCSEGSANYEIQLFDKLNKQATKIEDGSVYTYNAASTDEKKGDRFELLFTGIEKQNSNSHIAKNTFTIFPNPSENGIFYLLNKENEPTSSIEVHNLNGQSVAKFNMKGISNVESLDLSNLNKGIYILSITTNNSKQTQKIQIY